MGSKIKLRYGHGIWRTKFKDKATKGSKITLQGIIDLHSGKGKKKKKKVDIRRGRIMDPKIIKLQLKGQDYNGR